MMRAGEGDHHAVDLLERDKVLERREPAEVGEVVRARVALLLVVDVAREREPELGMVEDAVGEPPRDEPGSDDQRALPQGGGAVSGHPRARPAHTADRRAGDRAEERARRGAPDVDQREQAEHRPGDCEAREHDPRRLADAAGPRPQVLSRVEPAEERGDRPRDGDDGGQDERLRNAGARDRADEHAADQARDDVGREQQTAQLLEAQPRRVGARREQLELDALSVNGHQAVSPAD